MTRPGPLAAYTAHEAEIAIARATAIRALTATGATHGEAAAAVDEHLRRSGELIQARFYDVVDETWQRVRPQIEAAVRALGDTLARALGQHTTQADVVLHADHRPAAERDQVRAVIAARRSGRYAGPRPPRMDGRRAA